MISTVKKTLVIPWTGTNSRTDLFLASKITVTCHKSVRDSVPGHGIAKVFLTVYTESVQESTLLDKIPPVLPIKCCPQIKQPRYLLFSDLSENCNIIVLRSNSLVICSSLIYQKTATL